MHVFLVIFCSFSSFFWFHTIEDRKTCFNAKKKILTSERLLKHQLAGQNTQKVGHGWVKKYYFVSAAWKSMLRLLRNHGAMDKAAAPNCLNHLFLNLMVNRFKPLNNKIEYTWFNESLNSFKIKCKKLFLQWHFQGN